MCFMNAGYMFRASSSHRSSSDASSVAEVRILVLNDKLLNSHVAILMEVDVGFMGINWHAVTRSDVHKVLFLKLMMFDVANTVSQTSVGILYDPPIQIFFKSCPGHSTCLSTAIIGA